MEKFFGTYTLTEEEVAERSQQLAESLRNLEAKELEKKSVSSRMTSDINDLKEDIYALKNSVLDGKETKYFDCEVEKDFRSQTKRYYHNGQLIGTEPFTESDKQLHMRDIEREAICDCPQCEECFEPEDGLTASEVRRIGFPGYLS